MDAITGFITVHPSVLIMVIVFFLILFLYFIFKRLIKFILIILVILLIGGGYFFIKDPNNIKKAIDTVNAGIDELVDKSKNFYKDIKVLFEKGKEVPGNVNEMLKDSKEKAGK
jgi:uncharacterized membrane protein YjdF